MKDVEIEIQVRLKGSNILEKFLNKNGKSKAKHYQKDEYFTPPHKNFLDEEPITEWLRLRESKINSVNYKKWHYKNGKSIYSDEYESEVGELRLMRKMFEALGYKTIAVVEKTRKTWLYKDYEVAIDSITNLGNFVEVEYKGKSESVDPVKITTEMIAFLKSVGCTNIERNYVGYPYMLLYPDKQVFEAV
jgi:adenylate cyclase class 2